MRNVSPLLLNQLEGLLAWLTFLVDFKAPDVAVNDQLQAGSQLVSMFADMASELVFSSERALDVLMSNWTKRTEADTGNAQAFGVSWPPGCHISLLLIKFLSDEEGCRRVLERICSSKADSLHFLRSDGFPNEAGSSDAQRRRGSYHCQTSFRHSRPVL